MIVANSQPLIASRLNIVIEKCSKEQEPLISIHHRNLSILLLSQTNTPNSILHSSSSHTLHIIEIRMVQCLLAIDSSLRIIRQKTLPSITSPTSSSYAQQIQRIAIHSRHQLAQWARFIHILHRRVPFRICIQLRHVR